jgi:hypothetical protein
MGHMLALLAAFATAATPTVGCVEHVEPSLPQAPAPPDWIVAGPAGFANGGRPRGLDVERRGNMVSRKSGLVVEAGAPVTLRVLTPGARIVYRRARYRVERWQDADRVLRVVPCDPDTEMFSGSGTVGPRTGFAGGVVGNRRKCVRIRVTREGESWTARFPLGRRCR